MTKRITSEDCEGNIEDIEDGRYNSHVVPVAAEDDPGYEEIDYGDCTEFEVPLGRYGSHVVPIGGGGGGAGAACPNGGLKEGTDINGDACLSIDLKPGGAIILDGGKLAIDTTKLKVTTDNVYPAGSNPGIVYTGPDGEVWDTQADYNQWIYETISNAEPYDDSAIWEDQKRQDDELADFKREVNVDQDRQDKEIDELKETVEGLKPCEFSEATDILQAYNSIDTEDTLQWNSENNKFFVGGSLHSGWPSINYEPPESITINNKSYSVVDTGNYAGTNWWYELEEDLSFLIGSEVTVTYCPPEGFDDLYVQVAGDTMTGDLVVEANVEAEQVISRVVDSGENSNLELKHDGNTKVYVGKEQLTSQEKLKLNKEGTEDYHAVTKGYIDTDQKRQDEALQEEINARAERDQLHDAQISTIEYKLDQLVGLQFKGIYEFKHEADCNRDYELCVQNCMSVDPNDTDCRTMCGHTAMDCERDKVRPGYFEAVDPDDQFDHLEYIVISKADKAGVEVEWANVLKKDDYLEVDHTADGVLDKTNYGLYRIIEDPVESKNAYGEEVYTMRLEFLQGDGVMNVRENYEIRGITAAEGVNPEELGDFLTKDEAADLYALKTHGHAWGEITGKPSTYPPDSHSHSVYLRNNTEGEQSMSGPLRGTYFYGSSSSRNDGFVTRSTIESMITNGGGGSDGSDHNHDGRYPKMSTGTSSNPSLSRGDFYLNYSSKVLYIGT